LQVLPISSYKPAIVARGLSSKAEPSGCFFRDGSSSWRNASLSQHLLHVTRHAGGLGLRFGRQTDLNLWPSPARRARRYVSLEDEGRSRGLYRVFATRLMSRE